MQKTVALRKALWEEKERMKKRMHVVARNIRYICKEKSISYDELADGIKISRKDLDKIIYGEEEDIAPIHAIAEFLGVTEVELIDVEYIGNRKMNVHIVSNMKLLRMVHSMDYTDISEKTGINYKTLCQIAKGVYSFSSNKLELIANAFGITRDELLYHDFREGREEKTGKNLRTLRRKKGLNVYELSELSGVSFYAIDKLEITGEVTRIKMLEKLSKVLGVTVEELIFGDF